MWIGIVTLFPEMFSALSQYGVSSRAVNEEKVSVSFWNPRDFTTDKHQQVDDRPFGGGPGMVMQVEPLLAAVNAAKSAAAQAGLESSPRVVYLSPQGALLKQKAVSEFSRNEALILVAGRYEGVDERFIEAIVDEEWSIGDYVLSGGELAAMVLLDAVIRQLPGVLGHEESSSQDSFAEGNLGLLDCPHYTRPEHILGKGVPEVLLSGHHEKIRQWRLEQSVSRTLERRPELIREFEEKGQVENEVAEILDRIRSRRSGK